MSEFALLRYNVAVPEIDERDDILVLRDPSGDLQRIQVKTRTARRRPKSGQWEASFSLRRDQLVEVSSPETTYVLLARVGSLWDGVVIPREDLLDLLVAKGYAIRRTPVGIRLVFDAGSVRVGASLDLGPWRNRWDIFRPRTKAPRSHGR
jgi:hypothetical protein